MNVDKLAERLASEHSMSKSQARDVVATMLAAIQETAAAGDEVALSGFGKFKVQNRPARKARNPRTGEQIDIAATKKLVFQPAKQLRDAVAG